MDEDNMKTDELDEKETLEGKENLEKKETLEGKEDIKKDNSKNIFHKLFNKRNIIIFVVLVIIIVLVKIFAIPMIYYNIGKSNFEQGNYDKAVGCFEQILDYKDSSELLEKSYLEYGKELINQTNYQVAVEVLDKTKLSETKDFTNYAKALLNIENKEYDSAISLLSNLKDFEKSKENLLKAYYLKAEDLFNNKDYNSAITNYKKADGYEDSNNKINASNLMLAEEKYQDGALSDAKKVFEKLPKNFTYNDISVATRIKTLNDYKNFVNLTGTWKGSNGKMNVRQTHDSTGIWEDWTANYSESFNIKCKIKDDGSVDISGNVRFYSYTNYSTLSTLLNQKEFTVPIKINVKKGKSIPSKLVSSYPALISKSGATGKANVTYSSGNIKLSFSLVDSNYSANFTYKYTSNITFKK